MEGFKDVYVNIFCDKNGIINCCKFDEEIIKNLRNYHNVDAEKEIMKVICNDEFDENCEILYRGVFHEPIFNRENN